MVKGDRPPDITPKCCYRIMRRSRIFFNGKRRPLGWYCPFCGKSTIDISEEDREDAKNNAQGPPMSEALQKSCRARS